MRNLKIITKKGEAKTVKLPKHHHGKGSTSWYSRNTPTVASVKAKLLRAGAKLVGKRQ